MKVAIVWRFEKAEEIMPFWKDGIRRALELLDEQFEVDWFLGKDTPSLEDYDFILQWDSSTNDFIPELRKYKAKKGLMLTTELGLNADNLFAYDVIFCEADPVLDAVRNAGANGVKAFGTDTEFFKPSKREKRYGAFYPATFSNWKRQDLFAEAIGREGFCLGTLQPDGYHHLGRCQEEGTKTVMEYVPAKELRSYYNQAKAVVITAWEGSGRTVLEAMAMNIPVVVTSDNPKCVSYIQEAGEGLIADPTPETIREAYRQVRKRKVDTRKFILQEYNERLYADTLAWGIKDACG